MTLSHWADQPVEYAEAVDHMLGESHPYCVILWDKLGAGWVVTGPFATREEAQAEADESVEDLGGGVEAHIGRWFDVGNDK